MILSLVNVKGGVGKTTTAVNLAAVLGDSGLRVLVVDLDPQGSAGYSLGVPRDTEDPTAAEVLSGEAGIEDATWETQTPGVDVVAGSMALAIADLELARRRGAEMLLAKALQPVRRRYDFIIVDCPPGLSLLTVNGLAASSGMIVPTVPHELDIEALDRFLVGLSSLRGRLHRTPRLLGILLTMVDHRTRLTERLVHKIRRRHGEDVFRTVIPINASLAEAPHYGRSILQFQKWSPGGRAYSKLAGEVLRRVRHGG